MEQSQTEREYTLDAISKLDKGPRVVNRMAAQGDLLIRRVESIPADAKREERKGRLILAHSETGHHHAIDAADVVRFVPNDPLICFLQVASEADVVHHRNFDTHATLRLPPGNYEVRRQKEYTPEGYRRVED